MSNLSLLVDYKWENVKNWIFLDGVLHLFFAAMLGLDAVFFDDADSAANKVSKTFMIIYTVFPMLTREIYQMKISESFISYLTNGYNICDFLGQLAYLVYCIVKIQASNESKWLEYLHIAALFMLFARAITQLRIISSTRYLIRMIKEVVSDMLSFLVILFTSTFAFAVVFYKILNLDIENGEVEDEDLTYLDQFYFSFKLAILGDFTGFNNNKAINFFVFVLTCIF